MSLSRSIAGFVAVVAVVGTPSLLALNASAEQALKKPATANGAGCCENSLNQATTKSLRTNEAGEITFKNGMMELVEIEHEHTPANVSRTGAVPLGMISATQECETNSSSPDGRRSSCRSAGFVFVCPPGYYLVRSDNDWDHIHQHSNRGSENHHFLGWDKKVEIYPGTGIYVPTKVTWQVGARSNRGPNGSPGKTKATFVCEIRRLPRQ